MRRMTVMLVALAALLEAGDAVAARRRAVRCCVMVPAETAATVGETRPYCFVLAVRPAHEARRLCRAIGGRPRHGRVR